MEEKETVRTFEVEVSPRVFPPIIDESVPYQFLRLGSFSMPNSPANQIQSSVPPFLFFRPLPPDVNIPLIDCRKGDFPKCSSCKALLSPFVKLSEDSRSFRCPMCAHLNSTLHFTPNSVINQFIPDRQELHNLVYDVMPPKHFLCITGESRVFFLIIDESLLIDNTNSLQILNFQINELIKIVNPEDKIGLITYGTSATVYSLSSNKSYAYSEFDPSIMIDNNPFVMPAKDGMYMIKKILETRAINKEVKFVSANLAVQWGLQCLKRLGGKAILFTSGKISDEPVSLLEIFIQRSVSLSIFKKSAVLEFEKIAQKTGGTISQFGQTESLLSLFTLPTAWDAMCTLRTSPNVEVLSVMGAVTYHSKYRNIIKFPIINSSQSIVFDLNVKDPANPFIGEQSVMEPATQFAYFQISFRFTDDKGLRKIRVINGRVPFTDFVKGPIDEAAYSLYLLRKRIIEKNEHLFNSRVYNTKKIRSEGSALPILLYSGTAKDRYNLYNTSIERFALSVLVTNVKLNKKKYLLIWSPSLLLIYPKPNEDELNALHLVSSKFGLPNLKEFFPNTQEEFLSFITSDHDAEQWYNSVNGYTLVST